MAAAALAVLAGLLLAASPGAGAGAGATARGAKAGLIGIPGPRPGELRETVPIARRAGQAQRSVLSVALPRLKAGDRIRFNGEVTVTTTCVEALPRCIGRSYRFDPKLRAHVVLAPGPRAAGGRTVRVSRSVGLACEQTRPNRNHHCPLVINQAQVVRSLGSLPCRPRRCRLNMVLSAHHRKARGGEVVVIGADRPDGSVDGGKARINAAVVRAGGGVTAVKRRAERRRTRKLPASFQGGQRVVYSQRVAGLRKGDVLLVTATQRAAIRRLPYFIASKVVVSSRRGGRSPSRLSRRVLSRRGLVTETNGFNCTPGPSAFRSPCRTRKAGLAVVRRTPPKRDGRTAPLYVNLVSRTFPKVAQAGRASYPPARVLRGGALEVIRLRAGEG